MGIDIEVGTVIGFVYKSDSLQIYKLKTGKKTIKVRSSNVIPLVTKGDYIRVTGSFVVDESYGEQLHVNDVSYVPLSIDLIYDFIMQGTGIGKAIASRIIAAFPDNLIEVLEKKDVDALTNIERITRATALVVINQWHAHAGKVDLIPFVESVLENAPVAQRNRIKVSVKKSYEFYKGNTVEKLKEDPYRLWSFCSFKDTDDFAKAMGIANNDERRLICAVEDVVYQKLSEGHTQVYPLQFLEDLEKSVGAENVIKAIIAANDSSKHNHPRLIVRNQEHLNPVQSQFARKGLNLAAQHEYPDFIKLYNQTYALPGTAEIERYVEQQLTFRIEQTIENIPVLESDISSYKLPSGHLLNKEQKLAVRTVLSNSVSLVTGGGGKGKTSVLYGVNELIKKAGHHVLQVALAGKAAQRLIQQTNDDALTISSLLNKIKSDKSFLNSLEVPVFHIDEASMVDLLTMFKVLKAFEGKAIRLVFIGDWAQLPPIGPGLVFHRLMQCPSIPKVELKQNHRNNGGVIDAAEQVKLGQMITANDEVEIIEYDEDKNLNEMILAKYKEAESVGSVHIIAATKKMVSESNQILHRELRKNDKYIKSVPEFRLNDSVIYKKNNKQLGLVNGSTGIIVSDGDGVDIDLVVDFEIEGKKYLRVDQVKNTFRGDYILQHAYGLTCHAAQGSEFDTVVVILQQSEYIERSWLYTAITRAKKKVVLLVKKNQIKQILDRGFAFESINSGLYL
jgi:exodeoxyribonuclease V alpha subunit